MVNGFASRRKSVRRLENSIAESPVVCLAQSDYRFESPVRVVDRDPFRSPDGSRNPRSRTTRKFFRSVRCRRSFHLLVGIVLFCLQQLLGAWQQALPFPVQVNIPLLQFLGAIVAATLGLGLLHRIQSRTCGYPILRFNATQLFKDAGLMALTVASLIGVWWSGEPLIDLLAAAILLILAVEGFWQVFVGYFPLIVEQTAIAPEVIERTIVEVEGVARCYNIKSRGIIGRLVYISMNLVLEPHNAKLAPQIARQIEQVLRDRYGPVQITCTIENHR